MSQCNKKYDMVVCGGGTAGVAAGYIGAKLGLKTLIVEKNIHLGGTITSALVIPAMKSNTQNINCEFYNDFIQELKLYNGQITYTDGNTGWFNPELSKLALDSMLEKAGCDVLYDCEVKNALTENNRIKSLCISSKILSLYIDSLYYVDSTGDGNVSTSCVIDGNIHLSTACTWDKDKKWALWPLFQQAVQDGVLKEADTSYFQLFTVPAMPSTVSLNCPRILLDKDVDPLDPICLSKALIEARKQIWRIYNFLKLYLPGFEASYISNIADMIGIRESRRVQGKKIYTKDDILSGNVIEDPVLHADYPIDIHSYKKDASTLQHVTVDYELPIECLRASDYDNLYIAGRNVSADFSAQAALRIQTSCFSMGEAVARDIKRLVSSL